MPEPWLHQDCHRLVDDRVLRHLILKVAHRANALVKRQYGDTDIPTVGKDRGTATLSFPHRIKSATDHVADNVASL